MLAAAAIGAIGGRLLPRAFAAPARHGDGGAGTRDAAVIDDDTPTPAHARFSARRFSTVLVVFAALWLAAYGGLAALTGADGTLTAMAGFFTRAALLTFGGAYAVLPYVYQGAVEAWGWLTAAQMIDGLALGETTPGPLIMVVAFVGFVGGWTHALFGPEALALAGIAGAVCATFFTFLPSFLFILAGGPLVESTHGQLRFTAPLTGITAAVVGVIVNLALFFAVRVLWPQGFGGTFDAAGAAIGVAAAVALLRFGAGVIPVIAASGVAGLALRLVLP